MPDDALNKEPSDCRQPGSNKKSLDSDNREPTEQERNLKSQLQPEILGEQMCVCVCVCVCVCLYVYRYWYRMYKPKKFKIHYLNASLFQLKNWFILFY